MIKQKKVSTYLLYAIGEIVLVVAGILIAVQIDQWHDSSQKNKKIIMLLNDYTNDLQKDAVTLNEHIGRQNERLTRAEQIIGRLHSASMNFDSVRHIAEFEHDPLINYVDVFNNNTFNSMVASGTIELVENEIKNKMIDLDELQKQSLGGNLVDLYTIAVSSYMQKYPYGDTWGKHYLYNTAWGIQNERQFVVEYRNMSVLRITMLKSSNRALNELLIKTKELVKILIKTIPK